MNVEFSGDSGKFHLCLGVGDDAVRQDGYNLVVNVYDDLGVAFSAHSPLPFRMVVGGNLESTMLTETNWKARPKLEKDDGIVDIAFSTAVVGEVTLRIQRLLKKEPGIKQ